MVGIQNDRETLEDSLAVSHKTKHILTIRDRERNADRSLSHNGYNLGITKMSLSK